MHPEILMKKNCILKYCINDIFTGWVSITCLESESESEVTQSCPTLCHPVDCRPPGSSVHGISQARVLEWAAISFSRGSSQPRDRTQVSFIPGRCFNPEPPGKPHMPWGNLLIIKKKWSILKPALEYCCIAKSSISCEMRTFGLAWTKFSKGMELVPDPHNHLKVASTALCHKLLMSPHCRGISGYPGMQAV